LIYSYTSGLELSGNSTPKLTGRLENLPGGRRVEIDMGAELPVKIMPRAVQLRDVQYYDPVYAGGPLAMDVLSLLSSGQTMIREPIFPRQHIEKRARSLRVVDPVSGNIVCISGFGLIKDMRAFNGEERIEAGIPMGSRMLGELDMELDGLASLRFGNLQYQADGSVFRSGGDEPLGGYRLRALREKVAKTQQGQAILAGKAIVPNWLFTAAYNGMHDASGNTLGVGAYEIPLHLLESQLAEVALWLKLNGVENKLYETFIFNANLAARAMHEQDFVHSQLHKGNVFADLSNGFMPVITDFTTARSIRDFQRLPSEATQGHSPYQSNKFLDINILNSNLIRSLMYAQSRHLYPDEAMFLGILPPKANFHTSELENITHCMSWAYAAHLSPDGKMPSPDTITMIEDALRPKITSALRMYRDPESPENTILTIVQILSIALVQGLDPQPWHAGEGSTHKFIDNLASRYKAVGNRKRR